MKDFKDNIDEESIDQEGVDRFASAIPSRTFVQKALQELSRYSLLIIVGGAALSITLLHFQGKHLLQALRGTPLPIFWLEKVVSPSAVPDKTEVYEQVLAEEAKEAWKKRSRKITKPRWQSSYSKSVVNSDTATMDTIVVKKKALVMKRTIPKKQQPAIELPPPEVEEKASFFQPVKAVSGPVGKKFISCVVHGDQEVGNRRRMVLRLTESAMVDNTEVPAGTLLYGMARLAQNRIQIAISRIGQQPMQYQVYDHTYHQGIVLDEREDIVQDATKETAYRQGSRQLGRRRTGELPTQIASDLARDLLRRTRRKKQTIFLPDGYPLYIAKPNLR